MEKARIFSETKYNPTEQEVRLYFENITADDELSLETSFSELPRLSTQVVRRDRLIRVEPSFLKKIRPIDVKWINVMINDGLRTIRIGLYSSARIVNILNFEEFRNRHIIDLRFFKFRVNDVMIDRKKFEQIKPEEVVVFDLDGPTNGPAITTVIVYTKKQEGA